MGLHVYMFNFTIVVFDGTSPTFYFKSYITESTIQVYYKKKLDNSVKKNNRGLL